MKINKSDAFASIKTNFLLIFSFLILVTGCNKSELGLSINLLSSSFHDYQNPILKSQFNTSLQTKAQLTSRKPSTSKEIERVLYDFRSEQAYSKISSQQQAKIISTLPAEMRKNLCVKPDVQGYAQGSFTKPQQQETTYLIVLSRSQEANCLNKIDNATFTGLQWQTGEIVILSNNQLVTKFNTLGSSEILKSLDINQDGIDELLLVDSFINMGTSVSKARLVNVHNNRLETLVDFGSVYYNACGSRRKDADIVASRISIAPKKHGGLPQFKVENYQASCQDNDNAARKFKYFSNGKLPREI